MTCAYDELYLPLAQRMMGDMYDYAVNTLKMDLGKYQQLFLVSDISKQIANGNPTYIAGKNGCEVAKEVIESCTGVYPKEEDAMYVDKSQEYWIGWSLAYYQWKSGRDFRAIERIFPVVEMYALYPTLHEADISLFVDLVEERYQGVHQGNTLKRLRKYARMTQRELAQASGVPLRQIQLFEQGQRDLHKTQGLTLNMLAEALNCSMEELMVQ